MVIVLKMKAFKGLKKGHVKKKSQKHLRQILAVIEFSFNCLNYYSAMQNT